MVLSFINLVIFTLLLVVHIKGNMRNMPCSKLLTKVKTMILVLIIVLELTVFIRYTFVIQSTAVYDTLLISSGFIESIILFQICYFYTKKASHFLEDNKKIRKLMRYVMYVSAVMFLGFSVYQYWDKKVETENRSSLCHTFYFILPSAVNQIINGFFFYTGFKVMRTVNELNNQQSAMNSSGTSQLITSSDAANLIDSQESSIKAYD